MTTEEAIIKLIKIGYTADVENGIVYNKKGLECKQMKSSKDYKIIGFRDGKKTNSIYQHQFIWYIKHNEVVKCIDHKDRNKSNNRIDNLRSVSYQENHFNIGAKGYSYDKERNKWQSGIMLNKKRIHLGRFDTEQEAREAYLKAKEIYHRIE